MGGGTGGGGKFLSLADSFEKVTYEDVFGCLLDQEREHEHRQSWLIWIYTKRR